MSIINYFNETKAEMQKVKWPEYSTVAWYTLAVVVTCLATAYFLGFFDIIFSRFMAFLIK